MATAPAVGPKPVLWRTDDYEILAAFLATPTGVRFLHALNRKKPDLSRYKGQLAEFLLGQAAVFDVLLGEVVFLSQPESAEDRVDETPVVPAGTPLYPDLDDEGAWPKTP